MQRNIRLHSRPTAARGHTRPKPLQPWRYGYPAGLLRCRTITRFRDRFARGIPPADRVDRMRTENNYNLFENLPKPAAPRTGGWRRGDLPIRHAAQRSATRRAHHGLRRV
ncbi:hypothetical protein [Ralstonia solanacearum]|uniref:hypothetical protein n=1 Tax=Ralstonia solanacearum TaxID=305 RepID=UPI0011D26531|nr:hypothetical protein [Ralstonia solanacearum]